MTTKDKEILELAEVFGVGCQIQCEECPVTARFKTERPEDDELYGPAPCFIIEDGKCFDCVDYIRATAVYDAGYRKQRGWISVDERLPDKQGCYLVYTKYDTIEVEWYQRYEDEDLEGGFWWEFETVVTHWMPLPEAPKMKGGAE